MATQNWAEFSSDEEDDEQQQEQQQEEVQEQQEQYETQQQQQQEENDQNQQSNDTQEQFPQNQDRQRQQDHYRGKQQQQYRPINNNSNNSQNNNNNNDRQNNNKNKSSLRGYNSNNHNNKNNNNYNNNYQQNNLNKQRSHKNQRENAQTQEDFEGFKQEINNFKIEPVYLQICKLNSNLQKQDVEEFLKEQTIDNLEVIPHQDFQGMFDVKINKENAIKFLDLENKFISKDQQKFHFQLRISHRNLKAQQKTEKKQHNNNENKSYGNRQKKNDDFVIKRSELPSAPIVKADSNQESTPQVQKQQSQKDDQPIQKGRGNKKLQKKPIKLQKGSAQAKPKNKDQILQEILHSNLKDYLNVTSIQYFRGVLEGMESEMSLYLRSSPKLLELMEENIDVSLKSQIMEKISEKIVQDYCIQFSQEQIDENNQNDQDNEDQEQKQPLDEKSINKLKNKYQNLTDDMENVDWNEETIAQFEFLKQEQEKALKYGCLFCERIIPLTFHHLIPRTTHSRPYNKEKSYQELNKGIWICRECHSGIHNHIDEETMAKEYYTFDLLIKHEGQYNTEEYKQDKHLESQKPELNQQQDDQQLIKKDSQDKSNQDSTKYNSNQQHYNKNYKNNNQRKYTNENNKDGKDNNFHKSKKVFSNNNNQDNNYHNNKETVQYKKKDSQQYENNQNQNKVQYKVKNEDNQQKYGNRKNDDKNNNNTYSKNSGTKSYGNRNKNNNNNDQNSNLSLSKGNSTKKEQKPKDTRPKTESNNIFDNLQ